MDVETHAKFTAVDPPSRTRLSDAVCDQFERFIADGTLHLGERLPPERELAKQLKISRPSLREALLKLEIRGLLQVCRGGGFAVTDVVAQTVTDPLAHLLNSHPKATADVIEMRQALGSIAAYYAALRATEDDLDKLSAAYKAMQKASNQQDSQQAAERDAEFHLTIAEASHNVAIVHVMRGVFSLLRKTVLRSREVLFEEHGSLEVLDQQHTELYKAICARDPERAREAAHTHLDYVKDTIWHLIENADE